MLTRSFVIRAIADSYIRTHRAEWSPDTIAMLLTDTKGTHFYDRNANHWGSIVHPGGS